MKRPELSARSSSRVLRHHHALGVLLLGSASTVHASETPVNASGEPAAPPVAPAPLDVPEQDLVRWQEAQWGLSFYPSRPPLHAFRLAVGGYYDAIDPQVMMGYSVRLPQVSVDARYGLGDGWSLKGHFNSMFVTTELLLGAAWAWHFERWSVEAAASVGLYLGKLAHFAFDALLIAPEYRPELSLGYQLGNVALSLRGSLLLLGQESARVGELWGGFDNSKLFAGHSEMLFVENPMTNSSVWYFGLGLMTTRAYYALWVLFPDSPALFTYPRVVAGYEF